MEESELTRKAIEELIKEMDEYKEKEIMPTERKKNPLGRPNKLFLGRTINSIMNHNKREADRNLQRCEHKLKELDSKKTKHESKKHRKNHHVKFEYSHEIIGSDNSNDGFSNKISRRKIKKRRKRKYRSRSTSTSTRCSNVTNSSSSSSLSNNSNSTSSKKHRHKNYLQKEDYRQQFRSNYMGYYMDPNMAYAAMAYSQMSSLMHQQQLQQRAQVEGELKEESIEIPSDLSISCYSSPESSLNISLHSSSAEEDENGIFTFKLSSDDDEKPAIIPQNAKEKSKIDESLKDYDDKESLLSHISLESKDSEKFILKEANEIYELSSTDSDELEIVESALSKTST